MASEFSKDESNHWIAPLPFRHPIPDFQDNRSQALTRAYSLDALLRRDSQRKEHFMEFMMKIIDCKACEIASPRKEDEQYWYLPLFGVYHPKKRDSIRGVFGSSASFNGISLNSLLLSGPDLANNLVGVLLRFRKDECAVLADIEQMFYQFRVLPEHRNFLRFFWYKDNDISNPLIEYQMTVHVFGNTPSPSVANFGLRKTVENSVSDVKNFVSRNFYVDDGLISLPDTSSAVNLRKRTQHDLKSSAGIRLHKLSFNDRAGMLSFPSEDLAKNLKTVDLSDVSQKLPLQTCLGLDWNLNSDSFEFTFDIQNKTFTRRGLLSVINGIYDPLGFLAPIVITGKILLRDACPDGRNWDEPLSTPYQLQWDNWTHTLKNIQRISVPRMYLQSNSLSNVSDVDIHVYCDASEKAIATVAYFATDKELGFIMGKSKLPPISGNTIPRLELCSAVLATELSTFISDHLDYTPNSVKYFTDSKVVLGYIRNKTRRFYTYVANRVDRIHKVSSPDQWNYVPTNKNPADMGTRCSLKNTEIKEQVWIYGHEQSICEEEESTEISHEFALVNSEEGREVRPVINLKTQIDIGIDCSRFESFSTWKRLVNCIALIKHCARSVHTKCDIKSCIGFHLCHTYKSVESYRAAEIAILQAVQREHFAQEKNALNKNTQVPSSSSIRNLSPSLDKDELVRVGGRLNKASSAIGTDFTNPVILPKTCHVSLLLARHYHEIGKHQGRHITEGIIRQHGYWIVGAKRLISSIISKCFVCRRLRSKPQEQLMADLPFDRLSPGPPFTSVGVDTFGPWSVTTRKTRSGSANSKRWACIASRAIHVEVIEELSSSSFINALRRFTAIRGPVKIFRYWIDPRPRNRYYRYPQLKSPGISSECWI